MPQQNDIRLTKAQILAISKVFMKLEDEWLEELLGRRRFLTLKDAIGRIEAPVFNDGKAMHEQGAPAQSPYTLPLEVKTCPHGNPPGDCNDCAILSDLAYDAAREAR
jgi:hypothetical protein